MSRSFHIRILSPLLVCAASVALLSGCGTYPRVKGDRIDISEQFTYSSLVTGGIAVFGVTSVYTDPSWQGDATGHMTQRLEEQLTDSRRDLPITPTANIKQGLGPSGYGNVLEGYGETGQLDPAVLSALRQLIPDPRYLVFARVERFALESGTNLTMRVTVDVFDLSTVEVAWKGHLRTGRDMTDTSDITSDSDFEIRFGDESEYFWGLLDVVFAKFAKGLPTP